MITDPAAVKFSNEVARPLAEKARALMAEINAATVVWFAGMNAKFPNTSAELDDNRAAEGVSILTGADITNLMGNLIGVSAASNAEILSKPCVRALQAN